MTREEIDAFCKNCDGKRKLGECLLKKVCKECDKLYSCIVFCVQEKRKENENDKL